MPPSPLDSPRFFDDKALSGWKIGKGPKVAASRETFADARRFVRADTVDAPAPNPEDDGNPIPIEFVRGANGPDHDDWIVVVDGMRYQCTELAHDDGENVKSFKCMLPRGVPLEVITQDTKVRPVSIAVRLEDEAEMPLVAEVNLTQIIDSSEREDSSDRENAEKSIGERVAIHPYRTTDVAVEAVTMPYPFWAPAQSALGILSLKPINRHFERESAARAYNLFASVRDAAASAAYLSRKRAYESFAIPAAISGGVRQATDYLSKLTNEVTPDSKLTQADVDRYKKTLRAPTQPTTFRPRLVRPRPENNNGESFVIGGKRHSVVAELTEMFMHLVKTCERMRSEAKKAYEDGNIKYEKLSLRAQLGTMRFALITDYESNEETAALFDALLNVDPHPPAQFLLNLHSRVDITNSGGVFTYDDRKNLTSEFRRQYIVNDCEPKLTKDQEEAFIAYQRNLDSGAFGAQPPSNGVPPPSIYVPPLSIGAQPPPIGATADTDNVEPEVTRVPEPIPASDLPDDVRKQLTEENAAYLKSENQRLERIALGEASDSDDTWGGQDYMFLYDRMPLEQRKRTTLRTRINVRIVNFDGKVYKFQFESSKDDGIVAHSVYSEYRKEVDEFDIAAQKLVKCLFDIHAQKRGVVSAAQNQITELFEAAVERIVGKYSLQHERTRSPYFGNVFEILKYVTYDKAEDLAQWLSTGSPFRLDPCQTEERIAELRVMAREILPIWPPMIPPEPLEPLVRPNPAPTDPDAVELERSVVEGAEGKETEEETAKEQASSKPEQAAIDVEQQRQNAKDDANRKDLTEAPDEFSTIYQGFSKNAQETRIIVRELPQVVVPGSALDIAFLGYDFDDGQILVEPGPGEKWRWGAWFVKKASSVALWTAAASAGYLIYVFAFNTALSAIRADLRAQKWFDYFSTFAKGAAAAVNPFITAKDLLSDENFRESISQLAGAVLNPLDYEIYGISVNDWWDAWSRNTGAAPFATNLATWTLSFSNRKAELSKRYHNSYEKLQRRLVNKPANSAVVAGRTAVKKMRDATKKMRSRAGVIDNVAVIYNDYSGKRFVFYEYYENTEALSLRAKSLPLVNKGMEWASVPEGNALRLFPPGDVADRMYEVEVLRAMPITKTVSFTAGNPPKLAATTPSELAAKEAFQELMQVIKRARRLLRGNHLMQSDVSIGLELAQSAAAIIRAAYGISAGTTLVDGNDIIWTCLKGGAAARLAVRNLSLFDHAESTLLPIVGSQRVDEALRFWRQPRRAMMDAFVKAFVDEAVEAVRQERVETPRNPTLRDLSTEAARVFARAKTLVFNKPGADDLEKTTILRVVASSMAHTLFMNMPPSEYANHGFVTMVTQAEPAANAFDDQRTFQLPKPPPYSSELSKTAWASRRIEPSVSRSIEVGGGARNIIKKLAALDVSDACDSNTTTRSYYCPMGGRIDALPSSLPFAIDNLGARIVWIEVLQQRALLLTQVLKKASDDATLPTDGTLFLDTTPLSGTLKTGHKPTGLARHPLVVEQSGSVIYVPTSSPSASPTAEFSGSVPVSIIDAIEGLQNEHNNDIPSIIRARVRRMRTVAFNAERFVFALALSRETPSCKPRVEVRLRNADQIISFALALAILDVEAGPTLVDIEVYVDDVSLARSYVDAIATQAGQALDSNCRVCSLAEAALCM